MKRGFTLIELLVVIAIIGILSATVLVSLNSARAKAKDASRMATAQQIAKAVELYYHDHGKYPGYPEFYYYAVAPHETAGECGHSNAWCDLEDALAPYMSSLPRDTGNRRWTYKTNADGSMYGLGVYLDTSHQTAISDGGYNTTIYEVGPMPAYCMSKYTGSAADWRYWSLANICGGGS